MPALTTHFLFGEEVLQELPSPLSSMIKQHRAIFHYGLQGPDLLFFRFAISGKTILPKVGSRMHREKIAETMQFMKRYTAEHKNHRETYDILLTYFLGYICHYYLDKTIHPYVYFLVDSTLQHHPNKKSHPVHVQIESELDSILYEVLRGEPITSFSMKEHFTPSREEKRVIGELYERLVREVLQESFPAKEFVGAFNDLKHLNQLMYDPSGISFSLSRMLGRLIPRTLFLTAHLKPKKVSRDTANFCEHYWHHPEDPSQRCRKSVLTLFQEAKEEVIPVLLSVCTSITEEGPLPFSTTLNFAGNYICE